MANQTRKNRNLKDLLNVIEQTSPYHIELDMAFNKEDNPDLKNKHIKPKYDNTQAQYSLIYGSYEFLYKKGLIPKQKIKSEAETAIHGYSLDIYGSLEKSEELYWRHKDASTILKEAENLMKLPDDEINKDSLEVVVDLCKKITGDFKGQFKSDKQYKPVIRRVIEYWRESSLFYNVGLNGSKTNLEGYQVYNPKEDYSRGDPLIRRIVNEAADNLIKYVEKL